LIDEKNQKSLKELLKKIGDFPSIQKYGLKVSNTAWLVFQHSDNDIKFQKEGLKLMYECRKQNPDVPSVELTDLYYLTDRITFHQYGYQFFGTQNQEKRLIDLPEFMKLKFSSNPAFFCTKLVNEEYPENQRREPTNLEMFNLWNLAAKEYEKFGYSPSSIDENLFENLEKYKKGVS